MTPAYPAHFDSKNASLLSDDFVIIGNGQHKSVLISFFKIRYKLGVSGEMIGNITWDMEDQYSLDRLQRIYSKLIGIYGWQVVYYDTSPIEKVMKEIKKMTDAQKFNRAMTKLQNYYKIKHDEAKLSLFSAEENARLTGEFANDVKRLKVKYNQYE